MFIAHLPAGYLTTALVPRAWRTRAVTAAALVGSVLPDVDLLYFYLPTRLGGGGQREPHHAYWSHTPVWWIAIAAVVLGGILIFVRGSARRKHALVVAGVLFANVLLHHVLDTPVGAIRWLWPLREAYYVL